MYARSETDVQQDKKQLKEDEYTKKISRERYQHHTLTGKDQSRQIETKKMENRD